MRNGYNSVNSKTKMGGNYYKCKVIQQFLFLVLNYIQEFTVNLLASTTQPRFRKHIANGIASNSAFLLRLWNCTANIIFLALPSSPIFAWNNILVLYINKQFSRFQQVFRKCGSERVG